MNLTELTLYGKNFKNEIMVFLDFWQPLRQE